MMDVFVLTLAACAAFGIFLSYALSTGALLISEHSHYGTVTFLGTDVPPYRLLLLNAIGSFLFLRFYGCTLMLSPACLAPVFFSFQFQSLL